MLMDNKGRLFSKLNVIDLIVIILVIVAIGGVGYKFSKSRSSVLSKTDKVYLEFFSDEAPTYAADKVKPGAFVGDTERGTTFGKVAYVKLDKSLSIGQASNGDFIKAPKPGLNSVYMQVYGEGILNPDGGVNVNNIDYYIGKSIILRAGNSTFMGRIYNLSKRG